LYTTSDIVLTSTELWALRDESEQYRIHRTEIGSGKAAIVIRK